ncbi:hypothetical protein FXO37_07485 [Capsicum annuum]|nr:hypothetical protein FXO37_07485 [Capsicum annuum]
MIRLLLQISCVFVYWFYFLSNVYVLQNIKASEEISVIPPSLDEDKDAVSMAKSWLARSQPFLSRDSMARGSSPSLVVETLKILLPESKLLKLSMRELMNYEVYANRLMAGRGLSILAWKEDNHVIAFQDS